MPEEGSIELLTHADTNSGAQRNAYVPATRLSPSTIELAVYETLAGAEETWRAFEQHADCTVFQTFVWLDTWQRHVGARGGARPAIIVGRHRGEVLFLLPLATQSSGFARVLVWLGSDLCDYNAPLLAPQFSPRLGAEEFCEVWRRVGETLQRHPHLRYDFVRLEKMPANVGAQANPMLALGVRMDPSGAYSTPLADSWENFYRAKRSSATRRRDRTKRRRLAELGELALVHSRDERQILISLDTLIAQKSRALLQMGARNIFAEAGYSEFYRAISTQAEAQALVHISQLNCGAEVAAVNLGLIFRDTYYHLLASYDGGELSRFGPGAAHLHDLLQYAIERKLKTFDFTIGDEPYKRDWCDGAQKLYDHLSATTWRGFFALAPAVAKLWIKRTIKQTPLLWKAFFEARKLYASLMRHIGGSAANSGKR